MIVTNQAQLDRQLEAYLVEIKNQFGPDSLVNVTLDAVQGVGDSGLKAVSAPSSASQTTPKTLLSVLSHCYAVGLYNPADIEAAIEDDPTVSYLATRRYPSIAELRRFRREHRTQIQLAMVETFKRIWTAASLGLNPAEMGPSEWELALEASALPPSLIVQFGRMAEEHILLAQLWDGPALRD